jgi:hypothetical protein
MNRRRSRSDCGTVLAEARENFWAFCHWGNRKKVRRNETRPKASSWRKEELSVFNSAPRSYIVRHQALLQQSWKLLQDIE